MKKIFYLVIVFIFLFPITSYASISDLESNLCKSDYDNEVRVDNYEVLLNSISDCLMTNKSLYFILSDNIAHLSRSPMQDLFNKALNNNTDKIYNLDNIVDVMILRAYNYKRNYYDGTSEDISEIDIDTCTYNKYTYLDYEDYYSSILNSINIKGLSDYEKVYYIHNYICDSFNYDIKFIKDNDGDLPTLQSALVDRDFICGNYSVLTKDLLNRAGVDCIIVSGFLNNGEAHSWNLVKLNSKWYWLDTTLDDLNNSMSFFLIGNNKFKNSHKIAKIYEKSLDSYEISYKDYDEKNLLRPKIINISISDKGLLHLDFNLNSASECYIYLNNKLVKNNSKLKLKDNSNLVVKFNDSSLTKFKYKVYLLNKKYYLLKVY